ncbi:MAG: outer-membrane lipoprotein carrier protein LolA [Terriglobales bacterium]
MKQGFKVSGFQGFKVRLSKSVFQSSSLRVTRRIALQWMLLGAVLVSWLTAVAGAQIAGESPELEHALARMDTAAKNFKTTEASVVWEQYQKVIDEKETEKGKIYFRREGGEIQMAADFVDPAKYVLYGGGQVQVYQPKIDQVSRYEAGKNRGDVESFLVLGFGGGGRDLFSSYAVKFLATETVGGVAADKLELIPKSDRLRNNIARIWLWIDPRGISVQQQFFEPGGDYRLAKYSDIRINQKLPDDAFKLKTTGKTKFLPPQG